MAKDSLIDLNDKLTNPYNTTGKDFKVATPKEGAETAGKDKVLDLTVTQEGPRHVEDDGPGTPVPGDRSRVIAANFKEAQNKNEEGTSLSHPCSVDLASGQCVPNVEKY